VEDRIRGWIQVARAERPGLDHVLRARRRFVDQGGNRQAGAVTYFGFLSFFPLVALAFAIVGYLVVWFPQLHDDLTRGISDALPGLVGNKPGQVNVDQITDGKAGATVIGVAGIIWAGTSWVGALRESIRMMWCRSLDGGFNPVVRKLRDIVLLAVLGLAMLASIALSTIATLATDRVVDGMNLSEAASVEWPVRVVAIGIGIAASTLLFGVMFWRLSGAHIPGEDLWRGALLAGIGFEWMKIFATVLLGHTMRNPAYATFSALVGMLVWINLVNQLTLFCAAWTATRKDLRQAVDESPRPRPDVISEEIHFHV
jgi:membrane protein